MHSVLGGRGSLESRGPEVNHCPSCTCQAGAILTLRSFIEEIAQELSTDF